MSSSSAGPEWLGAVPPRWEVTRLANLFREVAQAGSDDLPILSVSIHDGVSDEELDPDELERKVTRSDDRSKYKRVEPFDLVYNMMRAWQGGFGTVQTQGMVSPAYVVARPQRKFSTRFVEHVLRTPMAVEEMRRHSRGVTDFRLRLYWDEFKTIQVALPPLTEQKAIVAFLDRETAKIDALVEEQRRLIDLLKEKRQAIISHAVTKGLDPNAKMKPSGVEWLGDVPAHWEVAALKRFGRFEGGAGFPDVEQGIEGEELPFFKVNALGKALSDGMLVPPDDTVSRETAARLGAYVFPPQTIVFAKIGAALLLGRLRQLPTDACVDNNMMGFIVDPPNVAGYFVHAMSLVRFDLISNPGTVPSLNKSQIEAVVLPIPPEDEQWSISVYLELKVSEINQLVAISENAIKLLQERRSAFISAAVTGKIDVRAPGAATFDVPQLVAAEIIGRLSHMLTFGRVKFQKIVYLAEADAGISELSGNYLRAAAGPLDRNLIDRLESGLTASGLVTVEQPAKTGGPARYRVAGTAVAHNEELVTALGPRKGRLDHIIGAVKDLDTRSTEAVATLYAVWNDFLLDGKQPTDAEIVAGVLSDWHPEKREKFRADELQTWLGWMRRNRLVPSGAGPHTVLGRLFP